MKTIITILITFIVFSSSSFGQTTIKITSPKKFKNKKALIKLSKKYEDYYSYKDAYEFDEDISDILEDIEKGDFDVTFHKHSYTDDFEFDFDFNIPELDALDLLDEDFEILNDQLKELSIDLERLNIFSTESILFDLENDSYDEK